MPKGLWSAVKKLVSDKRRHRLWLRIVSALMAMVVFCTTYALILPAITMERKTYCGLEEHEHTDECYEVREVSKKTLVCKPEDEADFVIHAHNDFCFDDAGNLICELPELDEHTHTDECYAGAELTCDKEETEGHTHSEECYERTQGDLTCTEEDAEHEHTDECYEWSEELICGQDEAEAHTHNEDCYSGEVELVCDIPEVTPHQHDGSCYENGVAACGKPEVIEHEHTAECVQQDDTVTEERVLICGKVEHKHTEECYDENYEATTSGSAIAADKLTSATALENGDEPKQLTFAYSDGEVSGVISIPWNDKLPDDLACTVVKLDGDEDDFIPMSASVNKAMYDENKSVTDMQLYRLEWTSDGKSYSLPRTIIPTVKITALSEDSAELVGAVITDKNEDEGSVFKEVSGIADTDNSELSDISNVMLSLYSYEDEDDATSEQALTANINATDDSNAGSFITTSNYEADTVVADEDSSSLELELEGTSTFALLRAYAAGTITDNYYKRIDSESEMDSSKSHLLVFQNGSACITLDSSTNSLVTKTVDIQHVKGIGNEKYVTVTDVSSNTSISPSSFPDYQFYVSPTGNGPYSLYVVGTGFYMHMNTSDYNWYLSRRDSANVWWISYLEPQWLWYAQTYSYISKFWSYDSENNKMSYESSDNMSGNMNILIYEYVGGSLDVADDIEESKNLEESEAEKNDGDVEQAEKPDYAAYKAVSGAQEETATLGELHTVAGATVKCTSDDSTSQIESEFGMAKSTLAANKQFEAQKENDGRLMTDKSVVYGGDDYSAIGASNYDAGDFSITLSALGQEWNIDDGKQHNETVPLDVVFIYDVSGSMRYSSQPHDDSQDQNSRWKASADAISDAIGEIMQKNSQNRVGVVEFSNTSLPLLELGRYTADNDKYFNYDSSTDSEGTTTYSYSTLRMADSLKDEATGAAASSAGKKLHDSSKGTFMATYTQRGIQEAYEMFARHNDTTVTLEGHDEAVKRQPVIVLVTDGDPTYCTFNYMDPKSGPNYGMGATFGIEGYYTILSANYFKNLTSIHYGKKAVFYTVGIGILSSGYGSDKDPYIGYDNSYMRAVLDPTKKNVKALDSYKDYASTTSGHAILKENWEDSSLALKNLLAETCVDSSGQSISNNQFSQDTSYSYGDDALVDSDYGTKTYMYGTSSGLGQTASIIYGIDNPYKSNYNYVDAAFFGYLDTNDMDNIFNAILDDVQETTRYDYLLKKDTSVTMTDPLGSGMMVKGTPVLRYFGTNYTEAEHTSKSDANYDYVTYYWKKTVDRQESDAKEDDDKTVDISKITLTVATNKTTKEQTVTFDIPESALPTYYPDKFRQFYYEELPVRAIYRVGLSTDEETKLNTAAGGSDKAITNAVYYTNKFDGDTAATTVTFYPDDGNPYYESDEHKSETIAKATNASDTVENSFVETVNDDGSVTQLLGNNGKLVLNRTEKFNITVKKVWEGTPADSVTVQLFISGTMTNTSDESAKPMTFTSAGSKVELNAANNWQYTWSGLPRQAINNGYLYNYTNFYVRETPMDGYTTTYKDKDGNVLQSQDFTYSEGKWVRSDSLSTSELSAYSVGSITWVTTDYTVDVVDANSGEVTIINSKPYELPESGGIGIEWFTLSGMTMIIATSFLYIQIKRKQKQNSRGGEA